MGFTLVAELGGKHHFSRHRKKDLKKPSTYDKKSCQNRNRSTPSIFENGDWLGEVWFI